MADNAAIADPTQWVRAAARQTLGSGSARVWHGGSLAPAPTHGRSLMAVSEGVADLARRRLRLSIDPGPAWEHLGDLLLERFPWLGDEDEDDREDPDGFSVYAGTARYFGHEGNWFQAADGDPAAARRSPNDPLWIVEALAVVDGVGRPRPGRELVRGASCRRAPYIVDPHAHVTELEVPAPYPLLGRLTDAAAGVSHRLTGEVWIGDEGRIHRASWTRIVVRRARWPFKAPQHRLWQTTELWDFGVAVDIEVPSPQPDEKIRIGEVVEAIGSLWRRKRAYERRTKSR
ncbi:MAG: hypothetical protein V7607_3191 [Solirubrobacteraceae bacterium]